MSSLLRRGHWYSIPFTDWHHGTKIERTAKEGLTAFDEIDFSGKLKVWIFQQGLLPASCGLYRYMRRHSLVSKQSNVMSTNS